MADAIAICGSLRSGSFNRKLLNLAIREVEALRLSVEQVDLRELGFPIYDGDIEEQSGLPPKVVELKAKIAATRGLLIVSPEYNASIPGGLKNAIDWLSRPPGNVFAGRVVTINGTSTGAFGTARQNLALKTSLSHLGCWVCPNAFTLPRAEAAFDGAGEFTEAWMKGGLTTAMKTFAEGVRAFGTPA